MSKRASPGFALAICLLSCPTAAFAGAWTLEAGRGSAVVTATLSRADKGFDQNRSLQSIPRYSKAELQALLEYGATNWFTVMFGPSLQHVSVDGPLGGQRSGLGYTDIGGRVRLGGAESWVVSGQAIVRVPGTTDKTNPAAVGYTDPEIDVRGLFGYSFKAGALPAFIDVQLAQRFRIGGPPDEFRADVTLGIQPHDRWQLLMQAFNVISEGAGDVGNPSYAYHKFQLSAVYAVTPALSLQLGAFTTYHGYNALQENGLVFGAWYKF